MIVSPPATLWPHQSEALEFCEEHPASLLYLGMGAGKTRIAANALKTPALVLTRSSVIEDGIWERELGAMDIPVYPLTGPISLRANQLVQNWSPRPAVYLVNHEGCWREPLAMEILRRPWATVVIDEIHHVKAPGSKVSRFAAKLGRTVRKIGLSGTPFAHSPLDVYGQYRFLDPQIYGTNFASFRSRYAVMGGFQGHQVIGYQNQDEFMRRFWRIAFRREMDFGLEDVDFDRTHDLDPRARALYKELDSEFWAEWETGSVTIANAAVKVLRLQQLAAGHTKLDDGSVETVHTGRQDLLADFLEDLDRDEPVVVFCRFTHDLHQVRRVAQFLGRPYSEVSGHEMSLKEWKEGKTTILGVQIQSGGEGIDLTRAALAVYYSVGHSLSDYLQSRARLVRPGQQRPVRFYHLKARGTVDSKVYAALRAREDVIQSLLNIKQGATTQ